MSYTHFTLEERKYLQQLLCEGFSVRKIAAILERNSSSTSREVNRNKAKYRPHSKPDNKYWYNHWRAQKWKHWVAQLDLKTCTQCRTMHGKIYSISESVPNMPPLHWYCRCEIKPMNTIASGECSKAGRNGADWWLMHHNVLRKW